MRINKVIYFLFLFVIFFPSILESAIISREYDIEGSNGIGDTYPGGAYNIVMIYCNEVSCDLVCIGGGDCECSFLSDCLFGDCDLISNPDEYYQKGNGQELIDYANYQITNNNLQGSYTSNIYNEDENIYYYRTVTWLRDFTNKKIFNTFINDNCYTRLNIL